ncbi:MAG: trigger factor [Hyphomicrobium sp.]|uniref:trigger factor n=1 Tax=Hyphomicrobium sp. TaxID=82 RepID=UPI001325D512|nr:trigger factor [Hyphomicrobium sp.]KAB2941065.1 MAG: trigger factor [Hyphomicrobium sp.]MBZ0210956.1 trigger factor [Hyphomicrobium sp.]
MQITETSNEGLKRTLQVVVPAGELGKRFTDRLDEIKGRVQLKGFRKGKVPVPHLKKMYGRSLMVEVLQDTVRETSNQALADRKLRPAMQPSVSLPEDQAEIERVLSGQADLSYSMTFEVLPAIELADFKSLKLERLVAEVDEEAVDKAIGELVERSVTFTPEEGRAAQTGDRVTVDFVGKIDGEAFEGGSAEGAPIVLGQGNFIPGFEEGIAGAKAGEERDVAATFPEDYPVATLAGKAATFAVKVKEVAAPLRPEVNDDFAKTLGAESVAQLKEFVKAQIAREYAGAARQKLKRELLDQLEKSHAFELPPSLVDNEFAAIWQQLEGNLKRAGKTFADEGKSEEETREEYRRIAERRVRLGLVIGEIAEKNDLKITQDEMRKALIEQARRFPGQEKTVYEYYEKTPGALAELRAPIFEDKVVDFVLEKAKPAEKKVSRDELFQKVEDATEA